MEDMKRNRRVVLLVLDSLGAGAAPDADRFGDEGADTLRHIRESYKELHLPNLEKMGLFMLAGEGCDTAVNASGGYGRMSEVSAGKDTTTGHWEIAGLITDVPFNTYPDGFPEEFIKEFEKRTGRKTVGNIPVSGTEIIERLGDHHEATGDLIVYTSEDSVFQIAANTDVVPLEELYEACRTARELLTGEWACARVIARPYIKKDGRRIRTSDRHDYSVSPPDRTMLDIIKDNGMRVCAVGKISDIFNGCGISDSHPTKSNNDGVDRTLEFMQESFTGIIFTNLVDFDSKYGHRRDPEGYGRALEEFDRRLPEITDCLKEDDILIITADHGNDPVFRGFNHTREYVPLMVTGKKIKNNVNLGIRETFADVSASVCRYLGVEDTGEGTDFIEELLAE